MLVHIIVDCFLKVRLYLIIVYSCQNEFGKIRLDKGNPSYIPMGVQNFIYMYYSKLCLPFLATYTFFFKLCFANCFIFIFFVFSYYICNLKFNFNIQVQAKKLNNSLPVSKNLIFGVMKRL